MQPRKLAVLRSLEIPVWHISRGEVQAESACAIVPSVEQTLQSAAQTATAREPESVLDWDSLAQAVAACTRCGLCKTRTQTVFGVGDRAARWMIVGEAPGAEEDARGEPFVGQAGRLLSNMLAAIGVAREQVYIANVLKCRPPGNRNPEPHEVAQCTPYLQRQLELVNPGLVLVLGRFAAQSLLNTEASIASLRGKVHQISCGQQQIPAIVSYHPAYLLRNLVDKSKSWADLNLAKQTCAPKG
jgi:uracil-DNA glycosylase